MAGVDPAYLARTSALYYHLSGATYDEVFDAWHTLEPAVAEKVALMPDRTAVRRALRPYVTTRRRVICSGRRSWPRRTASTPVSRR